MSVDQGICGEVIKDGKAKIFNRDQLEGKDLDIPAYSANMHSFESAGGNFWNSPCLQ